MSFELAIPEGAWQTNTGLKEPRSRLITTIVINGLRMHLEAWEVRVDDDGDLQEPTAVEDEGDFNSLCAAVNPDGHFDTLEIAGREYVLVATPYT